MQGDEQDELVQLDADERAGKVLTGGQRGRLADLRRAEILSTVSEWLRVLREEPKGLPGEAAPVRSSGGDQ